MLAARSQAHRTACSVTKKRRAREQPAASSTKKHKECPMTDEEKIVKFSANVEPEQKPEAPDPFDFKSIKLNGADGEGIKINRPILTVPVRAPSNKTWFRCHPDPAHHIETGIFVLEETREKYLLSGPEVYAALEGLYTPAFLRTAMTSSPRVVFLF